MLGVVSSLINKDGLRVAIVGDLPTQVDEIRKRDLKLGVTAAKTWLVKGHQLTFMGESSAIPASRATDCKAFFKRLLEKAYNEEEQKAKEAKEAKDAAPATESDAAQPTEAKEAEKPAGPVATDEEKKKEQKRRRRKIYRAIKKAPTNPENVNESDRKIADVSRHYCFLSEHLLRMLPLLIPKDSTAQVNTWEARDWVEVTTLTARLKEFWASLGDNPSEEDDNKRLMLYLAATPHEATPKQLFEEANKLCALATAAAEECRAKGLTQAFLALLQRSTAIHRSIAMGKKFLEQHINGDHEIRFSMSFFNAVSAMNDEAVNVWAQWADVLAMCAREVAMLLNLLKVVFGIAPEPSTKPAAAAPVPEAKESQGAPAAPAPASEDASAVVAAAPAAAAAAVSEPKPKEKDERVIVLVVSHALAISAIEFLAGCGFSIVNFVGASDRQQALLDAEQGLTPATKPAVWREVLIAAAEMPAIVVPPTAAVKAGTDSKKKKKKAVKAAAAPTQTA